MSKLLQRTLAYLRIIEQLLERLIPVHLYRYDRYPSFNYLCRKYLLLQLIGKELCGHALEVGFGLGDWLLTLLNIGFEVVGVEISERAINILKQKLSPHVKNKASILAGDFMKMNFYKKFDIVFALEVLEHIQDDETAIRKLSNFLSPDGKLIISVPAHMKYWTQWDIIAGHYRRYERGELIHKLLNCKLQVKKLLCYGFPFGTIISLIIAPFIPKLKGSINNRTKLSGIYRPLEERLPLIFNIIIKLMLPIQLKLQNLFLDKDFGHGYLIVASMRGSAQDSIIDSHH